MPYDFPGNFVLLSPPLLRHLVVERGVDPTVKLIDIHRMQTVPQPVVFVLQTANCSLMFLLLVSMAFKQCLGYPRQDLVAKAEPPQDLFPELLTTTIRKNA